MVLFTNIIVLFLYFLLLPTQPYTIVLTREAGKNALLRGMIQRRINPNPNPNDPVHIQIHELPTICTVSTNETDTLPSILKSAHETYSYITITSPEAANVFLTALPSPPPPLPRIAAVGVSTAKVLTQADISVSFVPSKATGAALASELPSQPPPASNKVLYPASLIAQKTIQRGLQNRGFDVHRVNTYSTVGASWTAAQLNIAASADLVCFASPSAVKNWLRLQSSERNNLPIAVCIGETSGNYCAKNGGWEKGVNLFWPEDPGLENWADLVVDQSTKSAWKKHK